ncbi:TPA: PhoH family protein [bacterium]|nr:PhoH family protein [bacterium]
MSDHQDPIKVFVIDTNVLIHYPEAILSFKDNEIVIPLQVLEELDNLKTYSDQRGKSARDAIRFLDTVSKKGSLHDGVKLENNSLLKVSLIQPQDPPSGFDTNQPDNKILFCAYELQRQGRRVFFVSKDINARVKAQALGLKAVDYEKQKVDIATLYQGVIELDANTDQVALLKTLPEIPWNDQLKYNQFVIFSDKKKSEEFLGKYTGHASLEIIQPQEEPICGIQPLNMRQRIALNLLLDDSIKLVTLVGKAGTGKTLVAIAAGLKKILEEKKYSRMLVTRPVVSVGKEIGYLPGEKQAKMSAWMQPIFDNLDFILGIYKRDKIKNVDQLIKEKVIEIEALSFIRGRSLPNQYIIIDEAQNLTPHEIKTIVSRAGENTKVVLTGDPYQIDNMYLDSNSNGLSYLVEHFKGQKLYGHVTLSKTERSELAELASSLL